MGERLKHRPSPDLEASTLLGDRHLRLGGFLVSWEHKGASLFLWEVGGGNETQWQGEVSPRGDQPWQRQRRPRAGKTVASGAVSPPAASWLSPPPPIRALWQKPPLWGWAKTGRAFWFGVVWSEPGLSAINVIPFHTQYYSCHLGTFTPSRERTRNTSTSEQARTRRACARGLGRPAGARRALGPGLAPRRAHLSPLGSDTDALVAGRLLLVLLLLEVLLHALLLECMQPLQLLLPEEQLCAGRSGEKRVP